jgi:HlyD family secretion protein
MNANFPSTAGQDRSIAPTRTSRKRWAGLSLLALGLLGMATWVWHAAGQWNTPRVALERLSIATVSKAPLVRDVAAEGKVVAAQSPTLYAPAAGTLVWQVQAGDAVQAGQVLARISSPELEARVQQERASSETSKAEWQRAQADADSARGSAAAQVATAKLELQSAQLMEKRQRTAFEAGASSALQWEAARDALERARIQLAQAEQALALKIESLRFEVEGKRAAFERSRSQFDELTRQQGLLTLKALAPGAIGQRLVGDGANVARDTPLMTVVDLRQLDVQLQVAESLVRDLAIGQTGEVRINGQAVPVKLVSISPEVVNGEVAARLRFDQQPSELRQNQRLSARILLERRDAVLGVQRGSFVEQLGGRQAWVLQSDGRAVKREVQLGARSLERVEVIKGLQEGERVIVSGLESQPAEASEVIVNP